MMERRQKWGRNEREIESEDEGCMRGTGRTRKTRIKTNQVTKFLYQNQHLSLFVYIRAFCRDREAGSYGEEEFQKERRS